MIRRDSFVRIFAWAVLLIATSVVVGWVFGVSVLKSVIPGAATMKINTAVSLLFCAGTLLWPQRYRWAPWIVLFVAGLTLVEYLFGVDLRIDQLLVRDPTPGGLNPAGRMSPITGVNFVLISSALLVRDRSKSAAAFAQVLAVTALIFAWVALLGYIYSAETLAQIYPYASIAVNTAFCFVLLCFAIFLSRPQAGFVRFFTSPYSGGVMARRLLPASVLTITVLGLFARFEFIHGVFDIGFVVVVIVALSTLVMSALMGWNARLLNRSDRRFAKTYTELEVSQRQLQLAMDSVPVLISYIDSNRRYRFVNAAYSRWFGHSLQEISGKEVREILGEEAYQGLRPRLDEALSGKTVSFEADVPYRTAGRRYISATYVPDFSRDGRVLGIFVVVNDISARKRFEERLRQAEEKYSDLYQNSPDLYATLDPVTAQVIECNRTFNEVLGYSREEVVGYSIFNFYHASSLNQARRSFDRFVTMGAPPFGDLVLATKKGDPVPASLRTTALRDQQGRIRYVRAAWRDVSELRAAERALKKANQELEQRVRERSRELELQSLIVSNMAEGVCLVKASDETIAFANPRFEAMFGYAPGELNGKPFGILNYALPGLEQAAYAKVKEIFEKVQKECTYTYEIQSLKKNGSPFWCRATTSAFQHPTYGLVFVTVQEDISVRKEIGLARAG